MIISGSFVVIAHGAGSRPGYIYDTAGIISDKTKPLLDSFMRKVDDSTSVEIVIYTIPSFEGHGIKKDGIEIRERDMLANYIFNKVSLDGITGIGKKGKDNGVLILFSLHRDSGGGSMRIEVGRGLEGDITDGTAGAILDSFLVPARSFYDKTGDTSAFDQAFVDTVLSLAEKAGYVNNDNDLVQSQPVQDQYQGDDIDPMTIMLIVLFFGGIIAMMVLSGRRRGRGRGFYGGYGGGWGGGGGGFGGGGGGSGGGGAGR